MNKRLFKRSIYIFIIAVSITLLTTIVTYFVNPDLKEILTGANNEVTDDVKETTRIQKVWVYCQ